MKLVKNIGKFITKNERVLLTIVTIGGEAVAIYAALKEGPKFQQIAKEVKEEETTKKEAVKELVVPTLKILVPFTLSATAAILNHKKASETISSLTNLYLTTKTISDEYKAQVEKEVGEETAEKIEKATHQAYTGPVSTHVYHTGNGEDKFYDDFSKRYFYSDANHIQRAVNDLNEQINEHSPVTVNEFYDAIGLPRIDAFDNFLWEYDETGLIRYRINASMGDDNKMFGIISFLNQPRVVRW